MGKKNLDELFQEKLSNFSDVPDEKVWHAIEASLDQKKKSKRAIPIWWKLGGAAAVLALALYLINPFESKNTTLPAVTDVEVRENENKSAADGKEIEQDYTIPDGAITDHDGKVPPKIDANAPEDGTTATEREASRNENESGRTSFTAPASTPQLVNAKAIKTGQRDSSVAQHPTPVNKSVIAQTEPVTAADQNTDTRLQPTDATVEASNGQKPMVGGLTQNQETIIAKTNAEDLSTEVLEDEAGQKSIFDEIAEKEQEEEAVAENKGSKWSAGPSIAPVYFDAIGEGSPVHSIFVPNSKSGDLNLSYGLSVAYEISDKLKLRSGVHRVDFGYSTDDVEFSSSLESAAIGQITNVNYSATAKNIVVASNAADASLDATQEFVSTAQDFSGQGLSQNGAMTQRFGYLEVPVELEYALLDRKFGVNLIGGVSSLFLIDNSISLSAGELTTQMGEANNVNNVNFSTNVGIGVHYKFSPKVQMNVEPVFKYQLNTFSRTEGTFQPFAVGVYSGLSFRF